MDYNYIIIIYICKYPKEENNGLNCFIYYIIWIHFQMPVYNMNWFFIQFSNKN